MTDYRQHKAGSSSSGYWLSWDFVSRETRLRLTGALRPWRIIWACLTFHPAVNTGSLKLIQGWLLILISFSVDGRVNQCKSTGIFYQKAWFSSLMFRSYCRKLIPIRMFVRVSVLITWLILQVLNVNTIVLQPCGYNMRREWLIEFCCWANV